MGFPIEHKIVVAVSATALFDLATESELWQREGLAAFRRHQVAHKDDILAPGPAFPFIQRLLHLNTVYAEEQPIEVVMLSRHHPDAGLRIMNSIGAHKLTIVRAFFLAGAVPFPYMDTLGAVLYLSTNKDEVVEAVAKGYPAGHVLPCQVVPASTPAAGDLRIAFDFDGVLVDDEAEKVYQFGDLPLFQEHEIRHKDRPLAPGPLMPLLDRLSHLQKLERAKSAADRAYTQMLRIAIVTARGAPAHERLINTLRALELETDELFLLGGMEKKRVLDVLKPHIFFDDQMRHLEMASANTPSVHVPFGVRN